MPQIVPMKALRDTNAIAERCHTSHEPIFVTHNGYGDLVVMSMETFDALIAARRIDADIAESEAEIDNGGEMLDARKALSALRRKHFG